MIKNSISNKYNSFDLTKTFKVKYASGFNAMAYFLTYQDIRDSIKIKRFQMHFIIILYSKLRAQ
jgi:hypothetical protein